MSEIGYHSEVALQKKRVLYEPVITTETLKEGYAVCYNNDRADDLNGNAVAAGTTNPARFLQVEKPATGNLAFVAGIVCPSGEGAVYGDWVEIYLLNGADIPVWTNQNCTNGTTGLFVTDASYVVAGTGASNTAIGLAKDTINRTVPGFCLMRSYAPTVATDYATVSGMISALSNAYSAFSVGEFDDVSDMASGNSAACDSIATDVATNSNLLSELSSLVSTLSAQCTDGDASIATDVATNSNLLSELSSLTSVLSNQCATGDASLATALASVESNLSSMVVSQAKIASDATSAAKDSCLSLINAFEDTLSDALSVQTDSITSLIAADTSGVTSANTARSTFSDAVETARSALSNAVSAVTDTISAALSNQVESITSLIAADVSIASAVSDLSSLVVVISGDISSTSALTSLLSNELSATSNVASEARASVTALDNDAVGASTTSNISTLSTISIIFQQITLADGTVFSCVKDIRQGA